MKRYTLVLLILLLSSDLFAATLVGFQKSSFRFAGKEEGAVIINTEDLYRKAFSPSDRSYKMQSADPVTREEFNTFMAQQTLEWTDAEKDRIGKMLTNIQKLFLPLKSVVFPEEIVFVKTTGLDEGEAACCRGDNAIFLSVQFLAAKDKELENTIIHELYHILTRNNPEIQEELFALAGFQPTGELILPPQIAEYKITNPDAVTNNHYFMGKYKGKPQAYMPLLLVTSPYNPEKGGPFFEYLGLFFIAVIPGEVTSQAYPSDSKPVVVNLSLVPEYLENLGRNSDYIIHPEESLADNFVILITARKHGIKSPEIIKGMKEILFR